MNRAGYCRQRNYCSKFIYCSNFSYYFPSTWSRGGWQSEVAAHGSVPALVWPFYLPWVVGQCPFDPYQAGVKVYRAYWAGGRPRRAARPTDNPGADAAVLPQVTSKRTLQCVQVTDAPAAIVRSSVRPSVRKRPRDNPVSTRTARSPITIDRPSHPPNMEIFEYIRGIFKEYSENMSSMSGLYQT
jgi:hypothetical protein